MRQHASLFLRVTVGVGVVVAPCAAQTEGTPRTPTLPPAAVTSFPTAAEDELLHGLGAKLTAVADSVAAFVDEGRLVGAELLVVRRGRILLHEAVGWSDVDEQRPLVRGGLYRIRSMTKPFIGAAVLRLYEAGALGLDDPAARYLPTWDNPRTGQVTIRQLLTHTSGFAPSRREGFPRPPDDYRTLAEAVDDAGRVGPTLAPGWYRYAGVNTAALGAIVQRVSGVSLEDYLQHDVLQVLGLDDTYTSYDPDEPWAPRMNPTYAFSSAEDRFVRYWHPSQPQEYAYFRAMGGMYATAMDYAKWLDVWMRGYAGERTGFLTVATIRQALTPGAEAGYGFQWEITSDDPFTFGHGGSDGTVGWVIPDSQTMFLLFTQSRGNRVLGRIRQLLVRAITGHPWRERLPQLPMDQARERLEFMPVSLPPRDLAAYEGTYSTGRPQLNVIEDHGILRARAGWLDEPFDLIPIGGHEFVMGRYEHGVPAVLLFPFYRFRFVMGPKRAAAYETFNPETGDIDVSRELGRRQPELSSPEDGG